MGKSVPFDIRLYIRSRDMKLKHAALSLFVVVGSSWLTVAADAAPVEDLPAGFIQPPDAAKPRVYWWWLNSLVSKEGITRDLEEYKAKGVGGVLLFDAGGVAGPMPAGPKFMSPEWRESVRHALREADRLGIEVSINLCSGWDAGGPWITPQYACKHVVTSELTLKGPQHFAGKLPSPPGGTGAYRDIAVQAMPARSDESTRRPQQIGEASVAGRAADARAASRALKTACTSLDPQRNPIRVCVEAPLVEWRPAADDEPVLAERIVDLRSKTQPDSTLEWDVPAGSWTIVRIGYTITGNAVKCSNPAGAGLEMDWLNAAAMDFHFKSMAEVLLQDAGPLAGKSLKYFHDDSWEVETPNWTDGFLEEFKKYRGYDARPYLATLAGRIVGDAEITDRFLYDYRKTIADGLTENHYRRLAALSHARGIGTHPEAAGPCYPKIVPMDALRNLGCGDIPMGEFWQSYHWHEGAQNQVGKQTAAAAHIYGKRYVAAEAFTSIGPHWQESPRELKPTADIAFCEGINRFVCHTSTSTRVEDGKPGFEYFAGTHFNRNVTWWEKSGAWLTYLGRCQFLLSQGLFVGDVCYYNGDWAPNFVEPKHVDPSLGAGYDYDVCNAEVLLTRMSVKDGRIVLPDGMSYRVLVLPERRRMPVEILRRIRELIVAGATVVGPRPQKDPGLKDYPQCDRAVQAMADEIWGDCDGQKTREHALGKGRVLWGKPLREILTGDGVKPDFEYAGDQNGAVLDFIHRTTGEAEVYFVANRNNRWERAVKCTFRVTGKQPEIWDPVTGEQRDAVSFKETDGRTVVPLEFAPHGSLFVVFRKPSAGHEPQAKSNFPALATQLTLEGTWSVRFDPKWGGPESADFPQLVDWTKRPEQGIKYYSGTGTYTKRFDVPQHLLRHSGSVYLNLGEIKNVAEVRLNGKSLGVVWTVPFRVKIAEGLKSQDNLLDIEVVNLWPNRLIGDAVLPPEKRLTRTNVNIYTKDSPLMESGLLGPVTLQVEQEASE
jgi:hypothetical protein